jgi:hypothetical protein
LPNFLIVGFPKCGTHALLRNLGKHPEIFTHPHEVNFFRKQDVSLEEYSSLFESDRRYAGEKSPLYATDANAMRRIADTLPDARLIICVRHPIHMMHSFYNFRVWEYENGFAPGFDPEENPFERIILDGLTVNRMSVTQGQYMDHIVANVLPFFDRQDIHVVIQERMWRDMIGEMNRVYAFLGAKLWNGEYDVVNSINQGRDRYPRIDYASPQYPAAIDHLNALYRRTNQALFDFLQDDIPEWRHYDALYRTD